MEKRIVPNFVMGDLDLELFGDDLDYSRINLLGSYKSIAVIDVYELFMLYDRLESKNFLSEENANNLFKFIVEFSILDNFTPYLDIEVLAYVCNQYAQYSFIAYPEADVEEELIYEFIYKEVVTITAITDKLESMIRRIGITPQTVMPMYWDTIPSVTPIDQYSLQSMKLVLAISEENATAKNTVFDRKKIRKRFHVR